MQYSMFKVLRPALMAALVAGGFQAHAQSPSYNALVASGGAYGAPGNYVKIGAYSATANPRFHFFDSIPGNSTAGLVVTNDANRGAYTADSTIVFFNASTLKRLSAVTSQPGLASLQSFYGSDFSTVRDVVLAHRNFGPLSVDVIINGMLVGNIGFSKYSAHAVQLSRSVSGAKYAVSLTGNYNEKVGGIALVNAKADLTSGFSYTKKEVIFKDTLSAGINKIVYLGGSKIYAVCDRHSNLMQYDTATDVEKYIAMPQGLAGGNGFYQRDSLIYVMSADNSIFAYDLTKFDLGAAPVKVLDLGTILPKRNGFSQYVDKWAYNDVTNTFYATTTDYFSYGMGYVIEDGKIVDSFDAGISPDALLAQAKISVRVSAPAAPMSMSIYPMPAGNSVNVTLGHAAAGMLSITDMNGRSIININVNQGGARLLPIDISALPAGVYAVTFSGRAGERATTRLVKQ